MITFEEALQSALDHATLMSKERVRLMDAYARVLAEDIFSDSDMPPFDKSAVDGYACRIEDIIYSKDGNSMVSLFCIETIPAGKIPENQIMQGQCANIMTGGVLPEGADCVVMVEDTEILENGYIRISKAKSARNICFKGEDITKGNKVLSAGTMIRPQHIAVLASVGAISPSVFEKVKICVLSTGDELVEPEHVPSLSKIRNSNSYQMMAQLERVGALSHYGGIAEDNENALKAVIAFSMLENDLILLTGGVSMGDLDYLPKVLEDMGVEIIFRSIAIQPGKPALFGKKGQKYIFGLPGNPVAAFVLFEILVKPFIQKMSGKTDPDPLIKLHLGVDFERKKSSRKAIYPVKILHGEIFPVEYHGSAHIHAYTQADGIISMSIGETLLKRGTLIDIKLV